MKKTFTLAAFLFLVLSNGIKAQSYIPQAVQLVHNSADNTVSNLKIWVNDTVWVNTLSFQQATPKLSFAAGTHTLGISSATATSQAQSIIQQTFDFNSTIDDHFMTLNGILGNALYPLTIVDYTSGPTGLPSPYDAYCVLFNGCVNCGAISANATCTSVPVTTLTAVNSITYSGLGAVLVQTSPISGINHTLTLAISSSSINYGSFVMPLQSSFQKFNKIIMNGSFNQNARAAGIGFGLVVVPETGGALTTLKKIELSTWLKEENNRMIEAQIAPNPCAGQLNVTIVSTKSDFINLEIIDLMGKKLMEFPRINTLESPQKTLNITTLDAGVYFLKIDEGINEKSIKFIKE